MNTRRSVRNQNRMYKALTEDLVSAANLSELAAPWDGKTIDLLRVAKRARAELAAMHNVLYMSCDGGCPADDILRELAATIKATEEARLHYSRVRYGAAKMGTRSRP